MSTVARRLGGGPLVVIAGGGMIIMLSIGTRQAFGLFRQPLSGDLAWGREVFALAIAFQNLLWGLSQPVAGLIAGRYGSGRVLAGGGVLYAAGVPMMSQTSSVLEIALSGGLLVGLGLSGSGFAIGMHYLGTLFGIVFLSHQVGGFLGVWLGGLPFDRTGDYTIIWWIAIVLGVLAALLHWPIDEKAVTRTAPAS